MAASWTDEETFKLIDFWSEDAIQAMLEGSLVPRPSYHGVPVRGPGNSGLRMRLIKTARYA